MLKNNITLFFLICSLSLPAFADEGMWPYNMVPKEEIKTKYGVELDDAFLKRAMLSSVRFNNGGSGSFVSSKGLVMTNHHVGADCIQKLSTGKGALDVMKEGFVAGKNNEKKCPDLELNQVREIEDVTAKVRAAEATQKSDADKNAARKKVMGEIEKACADSTKMRCDVVTLYGGGAYHLYKYKKFTDVRLVFAPEFDAAFFGGDPDNFTFPRYCLDAAFFRVYENGKPVATKNHFPFSAKGAQDGDLVFVSGNPGSTDRFAPVSKLEFLKDPVYPWVLKRLAEKRDMLKSYMNEGEAQERAARDDYFGIENSIKALTGYLSGLEDEALMNKARTREKTLLEKVRASKKPKLADAWPKLAATNKAYAPYYRQYSVSERFFSPSSGASAHIARDLLRLSVELPKKSEERLREYRDSNLKSLELALFSEATLDEGLEIRQVAFGLTNLERAFGKNHPLVKRVLQGKTPIERASAAVTQSKIKDIAFRKSLYKGGKKAVDAANDSLIELVRLYDDEARKLRKKHENEIEAVQRANAADVAEAFNVAFGQSIYPDATFTLRLNHGVVKGYTSKEGQKNPWVTQLGGLYVKNKRANDKDPYRLPKRFKDAMSKVDFSVPVNFVSTNDIIGGNSGSPVFNRAGEIVGLIFDGNIEQLPNRFVYTDKSARSVSVHSQYILHALIQVYGANALASELRGK